jgi:hypothetical protein
MFNATHIEKEHSSRKPNFLGSMVRFPRDHWSKFCPEDAQTGNASTIRTFGKMKAGKKGAKMKILQSQEGRIGYLVAWLLGIPIPILLLVFLLRGCN